MRRSLHKEWRDSSPFTRRVRWYKPGRSGEPIRLEFTGTTGVWNRLYTDPAQRDYDRFVAQAADDVRVLRP